MKPIEIKILMMRAGITHVALAKKLGVTDPMIHQVISGHRHTPYIREAIAEAVGKPVEKLWPKTKNGPLTPTLSREGRGERLRKAA